MKWNNQGKPGNWQLNMIATNNDKSKTYCVGTENNIGVWSTNQMGWINMEETYGLGIKMVAFDSANTLWCVQTDGQIFTFDTNRKQWLLVEVKTPNNIKFKMIAFQHGTNKIWAIDINGNLYSCDNPDSDLIFTEQKGINWELDWIAFAANEPESEIYCVGVEGNIGKFETDHPNQGIAELRSDWTLKMIHFSIVENELHVLCVGAENNVGYYDGN